MQEQKYPMNNQGEIILYQPDETIKVEVRLEDETVWLTQAQMAELFDVKEHTITYHIKEIYNMGELEILRTTRKIRVVRKEGSRTVNRNIDLLKDYLLKGYAINQRLNTIEQRIENKFMQHEQRLNALDQKIAFFVHTSLLPVEGIFYNGQIFDAYKFATALTSLL